MKNNLLIIQRRDLLTAFAEMGFRGFRAFCNVCKSINSSLDGFELFLFWGGNPVSNSFCNNVSDVIQVLKKE